MTFPPGLLSKRFTAAEGNICMVVASAYMRESARCTVEKIGMVIKLLTLL